MIRTIRTAALTLALVFAACEPGPTDVTTPQERDGVTPVLAAAPGSAMEYSFHLSPLACPDCPSGIRRLTPSNVLHVRDFGGRFAIIGDLTGELRFFGAFQFNLRNGKGLGTGRVTVDLTGPAVGSFECDALADYVDYSAAAAFQWIEHTRYIGCQGTGAYAGARMVARVDNEANPGIPLFEGVARIW